MVSVWYTFVIAAFNFEALDYIDLIKQQGLQTSNLNIKELKKYIKMVLTIMIISSCYHGGKMW